MRTNTLLIKTPEGVVFTQPLADPVTRFLAWLIDFCCVAVLVILTNILISLVSIITPDFGQALGIIAYFVITLGYAMALEWKWRGQTIGKRVLRLRVIDAAGLRLQFSQVAIRNLLRAVDMMPLFYLVGGAATLLSGKAQRLGDLAANTVVVRIPRITEPNLDQLGAGKFNSLRSYPHLCARLRQRVTPAEAGTALQAIMRRDEITPAERVQLFAELAAHFKEKVEFPTEALDGIADEQYVRNVADVLYRMDNKPSSQHRAPSPEPAPTQRITRAEVA